MRHTPVYHPERPPEAFRALQPRTSWRWALWILALLIVGSVALRAEETTEASPDTYTGYALNDEGTYDVVVHGKTIARCETIEECPMDLEAEANRTAPVVYVFTLLDRNSGEITRTVAAEDSVCPTGCNSVMTIQTIHPEYPSVKVLEARTSRRSSGQLTIDLVPVER